MEAYRKIAVARCKEDLEQIEGELADVYGPVPEEVGLLLEVAELRIGASRWGVKAVTVSGQDLVFSFVKEAGRKEEGLLSKLGGKVWFGDGRTVYWRPGKNYFEPGTLTGILRKIFAAGKKPAGGG
jgi:hypothetical protein